MITRMRIVHADGTVQGKLLFATDRSAKPITIPPEYSYVKVMGSDVLYTVTSITSVIFPSSDDSQPPNELGITVIVEDARAIEVAELVSQEFGKVASG